MNDQIKCDCGKSGSWHGTIDTGRHFFCDDCWRDYQTAGAIAKICFKVSSPEAKAIQKIAVRASALAKAYGLNYTVLEADMDITACHANGCPLDISALLAADLANFSHDVMGIRRHINRKTGKLENCFVPRYAFQQ